MKNNMMKATVLPIFLSFFLSLRLGGVSCFSATPLPIPGAEAGAPIPPTNSLPDFIPFMGDEARYNDWVTNRIVESTIRVESVTETRAGRIFERILTNNVTSYGDLMYPLFVNTYELIQEFKGMTGVDQRLPVRVVVESRFHDSPILLHKYEAVTPFKQTRATLVCDKAVQDCRFVEIRGLKSVEINMEGVYTNSWTPDTVWTKVEGIPEELTTSDTLIINRWQAMGTNKMRVTIETETSKKTYTHFGHAMYPPWLSMHLDADNVPVLTAHIAPGTEALIDMADLYYGLSQPFSTITASNSKETITCRLKNEGQMFYKFRWYR